jgi:hypothetical protein
MCMYYIYIYIYIYIYTRRSIPLNVARQVETRNQNPHVQFALNFCFFALHFCFFGISINVFFAYFQHAWNVPEVPQTVVMLDERTRDLHVDIHMFAKCSHARMLASRRENLRTRSPSTFIKPVFAHAYVCLCAYVYPYDAHVRQRSSTSCEQHSCQHTNRDGLLIMQALFTSSQPAHTRKHACTHAHTQTHTRTDILPQWTLQRPFAYCRRSDKEVQQPVAAVVKRRPREALTGPTWNACARSPDVCMCVYMRICICACNLIACVCMQICVCSLPVCLPGRSCKRTCLLCCTQGLSYNVHPFPFPCTHTNTQTDILT